MKLPSEVLNLGSRIVHELEMNQRTSTLSRWMAHHLAEIIQSAEDTEGGDREAQQEKAVRLIMELWNRRRSLPGNAYPLRQLEDVISVLSRLRPEASPFFGNRGSILEEALSGAINSLQVIVIYGAILAAKTVEVPEDMEVTSQFLDDEENQVIETIKSWIEFGEGGKLTYHVLSGGERKTPDIEWMRSKAAELDELDLQTRAKRIVYAEIEGLTQTLSGLKKILDAQEDEVDVGK